MGINEKLERMEKMLEAQQKKPEKKFKLPMKGKLSNGKLKAGYVTVVEIQENKVVNFKKMPIIDGTIKLDDTFHAVSDSDIFLYKGKPIIFQSKNKLNPYNPLEGEHETYGQKYVMARMEGDKLTLKKKIGWGMSIGILVIIGIIAYSVLAG